MYKLEFGEEESREQHGIFLLTNIGKLYAAGGQPNVTKLFRPVTFPVSRGTPMLNSKIEWDHSQRIFVPKFGLETQSGETIVDVNLSTDEDAFYAVHTIDGRILFPATGYMTLAWRTFAKMRGLEMNQTPRGTEKCCLPSSYDNEQGCRC